MMRQSRGTGAETSKSHAVQWFAVAMLVVCGALVCGTWMIVRPGEKRVVRHPEEHAEPTIATRAVSRAAAVTEPTPVRELPPASSATARSGERDIDLELSQPLGVEQTGLFQKAYAAWDGQPIDETATESARRYFDTAFSKFDIHPDAQYVRCGDSLCRGRFRFAELKELYKMTQIGEADGVKIATTFPEGNDNSQSVSIYWTRKANPEGPLTETEGQ